MFRFVSVRFDGLPMGSYRRTDSRVAIDNMDIVTLSGVGVGPTKVLAFA